MFHFFSFLPWIYSPQTCYKLQSCKPGISQLKIVSKTHNGNIFPSRRVEKSTLLMTNSLDPDRTWWSCSMFVDICLFLFPQSHWRRFVQQRSYRARLQFIYMNWRAVVKVITNSSGVTELCLNPFSVLINFSRNHQWISKNRQSGLKTIRCCWNRREIWMKVWHTSDTLSDVNNSFSVINRSSRLWRCGWRGENIELDWVSSDLMWVFHFTHFRTCSDVAAWQQRTLIRFHRQNLSITPECLNSKELKQAWI